MTAPTPDAAPDPAAQPTDGTDQPDPSNDSTDWKAEARKWEQRAKDNQKAAKDLEAQRKAAMTEADRAVLEAEERGRKSAVDVYGSRLARTEFIAEAAKRNSGFDATSIIDDLNLARYIGEDGEPDSKAIVAAVERIVPVATASNGIPRPDLSQGPRTTASGSTADQFAAAIQNHFTT